MKDEPGHILSFGTPFSGHCRNCKKELVATTWMIVVADERPDLADAACRGVLNCHICGNCRSNARIDAPLLYIDIARSAVVFVPPYVTDEEKSHAWLNVLLAKALERVPDEQKRVLRSKLCVVIDPQHISQLLSGDTDVLPRANEEERKARQIRLGLGRLPPHERLERMIQLYDAGEPVPLSPEEAQEPFWSLISTKLAAARTNGLLDRVDVLEGMLRVLADFRQKVEGYYEPGTANDRVQDSADEVVRAFLQAGDLRDSKRVLDAAPNVLESEVFWQAVEISKGRVHLEREAVARIYKFKLALLDRCRTVGLTKAFDEVKTDWLDLTRELGQARGRLGEFRPSERLEQMIAVLTEGGQLAIREHDATDSFVSLAEKELSKAVLAGNGMRAMILQRMRDGLLQQYFKRMFRQFLAPYTWSGSRKVLEEHPRLLDDKAATAFEDLIQQLSAAGLDSPFLREHAEVLSRCRGLDLSAAFAGMPSEKSLTPQDLGLFPVGESLEEMLEDVEEEDPASEESVEVPKPNEVVSPMFTTNVGGPVEIFYSYAHADAPLRSKLEKHLALLKREGVISGWHDRQITPGAEWKDEIDAHLETASVVLLLISADFMASDYCYGVEMKRALARHQAGDALVIPIILRPVDWQQAALAHLQALPRDAKPVVTWRNRDEAFKDVARGIRLALRELASREVLTSSSPDRYHVRTEIFLWDSPGLRRCRLGDPGSLPVWTGSRIQVEVHINKPAYMYVVWVCSDGSIQPLYPWAPGEWRSQEPVGPRDRLMLPLSDPPQGAATWTIDTPAGLETLIVMVRPDPLPEGFATKLPILLSGLPTSGTVPDPTIPYWFECSDEQCLYPDALRLNLIAKPIEDPLFQIHAALRDRLGVRFHLIRSVTFANSGRL